MVVCANYDYAYSGKTCVMQSVFEGFAEAHDLITLILEVRMQRKVLAYEQTTMTVTFLLQQIWWRKINFTLIHYN